MVQTPTPSPDNRPSCTALILHPDTKGKEAGAQGQRGGGATGAGKPDGISSDNNEVLESPLSAFWAGHDLLDLVASIAISHLANTHLG